MLSVSIDGQLRQTIPGKETGVFRLNILLEHATCHLTKDEHLVDTVCGWRMIMLLEK
jgi:hypothetical protein